MITLEEPKTAGLYKLSINLLIDVIMESLYKQVKIIGQPFEMEYFHFFRLLLSIYFLNETILDGLVAGSAEKN